MGDNQNTIGGVLSFSGKGLHTGAKVTMTVHPAPANHGIVFRRIDIEGQPTVPALCDYVTDTARGTTIERDGARVSTVEHIMSALWTMGVDNALIDIDGPETPIMDGSALEYAENIARVGITEQNASRRYYEVTEKQVYTIPEKGVAIILYPDDEFSVSVHVDYNSKVVGNQYAVWVPGDDYITKIAPCRTFVFLHELEALFNMGLIKGGDIDNAIVVVENPISDERLKELGQKIGRDNLCVTGGYLNNLQLRANNELARHKLLDLLGDFALLGMRIKGRVWATRPGHFANTEFMKQTRMHIRRDGVKPRFKYDPSQTPVLDIPGIRATLPHRYPFMLIDRVFHLDDTSVGAIKQVSINEPFFQGHFPDEPIMPGVLIVEALAQCCGVLGTKLADDIANYSTYLIRIDNVRFKQKVVAGDTLQLEVQTSEPMRRNIATVEGKAFVNNTLVCEATIMAQIVKKR